MITEQMIEETVATCAPPRDWMVAIGLTNGAERLLRSSALMADLRGSDPGAIRMAGFQIGFELARKLSLAEEHSEGNPL